MSDPASAVKCLNCQTTDESAPLIQWRYRGRPVWVCADCLPLMIHKRHLLADKLPEADKPAPERTP